MRLEGSPVGNCGSGKMKRMRIVLGAWRRFGHLVILVLVTLCTLSLLDFLTTGVYYTTHKYLRRTDPVGEFLPLIWFVLSFGFSIAAIFRKKREGNLEEPGALLLLGSGMWVVSGIAIEVLIIALLQNALHR
jgi:hypothetical protein